MYFARMRNPIPRSTSLPDDVRRKRRELGVR